ncbi:hypothetical protein ACH49_01300 [Streptomyces leeuwenhoekii]|uniref:Uncharacterized protein n=1 Tax=Streptomyces leeuwenhoekii TaxID=1437453 RepID=A0ABR5I686_STRLW|nr:hypothetical protein [Streptomyces leeuwenhoekii]KMS81795.1 hypothetical protein ACH49_01300 [Streptomyces leeuwenhoekii]
MTPDEIRQQLDVKAARIHNLRDLAPHAKQTLLARAYVEARDALNRAREEETQSIEAQRRKLERKLFGNDGMALDPSAAINRREANDRAAKLDTADEALRAMQRAERDGDTIMAKAIAARAAELSLDPTWAGVLQTYVQDKPGEAETLNAMRQLPDTSSTEYTMQQAMRYMVAQPQGLNAHSDWEADSIAQRVLDGETAA